MKSLLVFCMVLIFTGASVSAKTFTKCGMARELLRRGFSRNHLSDWVCLIKSESSYKTNVVGPPNTDNSYDWGLFQINDKYWCQGRYPNSKNVCKRKCSQFLKDDISASVKCALHIKSIHGFSAWEGWKAKCQGKNFDLSSCQIW